MKQSLAANAAIGLVVIGWLSCTYGVLSQLGDPSPLVQQAELDAHRRVSIAFILVGVLSVLCSLWLSGYSFMSGPRRSVLATMAAILPIFVFFFFAFGTK